MKKWLIALGIIFFVGALVYGDGMLPLITGTALSLLGTAQDRTAAGTDADHNGIRDDVDALIAREYQASRTQSRYAQMLAKTIQLAATSSITQYVFTSNADVAAS